MNLLLDTHVLLWFLADDPKLLPSAKERIENPSNRKLVSVATCWEISIKAGLKKLDLGEPASTFLLRELETNSFELLGIELSHVTLVETLPIHHRDPFTTATMQTSWSFCLVRGVGRGKRSAYAGNI
ncbi:MAG: type II toxin-antitoxin system VapC family toxin [Cyanobacteriota bacterium]|nr:type II toxin-antitoxin system VapC family toxin [Cyanobacteriota bacterium]